MVPKNRKPTHPGKILLEELLKPMGMSQVELARKMGVSHPAREYTDQWKAGYDRRNGHLLSRVLKTSSEFWMNLQVAPDLHQAQRTMDHTA